MQIDIAYSSSMDSYVHWTFRSRWTRLDDRLDLEASKSLDLGPSKSFTFSYWNQNKTFFGGIWDCHYLQSIYETTMNNHGEWNTTWGDHPSRVLPAFVVCNMVFISLMQFYLCAKGFCLVNNAIVGTCGSNILISETKQVWSKSMFFLHYFAVDGRYQVYQLA